MSRDKTRCRQAGDDVVEAVVVGVGSVREHVVGCDCLPLCWVMVVVAAVDAALLVVVVAVVVGGQGGVVWWSEVECHCEVGGVVVDGDGVVAVVVVGDVVVVGYLVVRVVLVEWVEVDVVVVFDVGDDHRDVGGASECVLKVVLVVGHVDVSHVGWW